jgi:putative multicomponent Na+:H+ antiporter subunit B
MADSYVYGIVALLPLAASMLVVQVNPYHALVLRGILGAVAALVYTVLGAADVALTEALVGTMLAIALYAVAVRSSLVMRLGVLKDGSPSVGKASLEQFEPLMKDLRTVLNKHHLRLELVNYANQQDLYQALINKEVHAICTPIELSSELKTHDRRAYADHALENQFYQIRTRIRRIYEIMQTELSSSATNLAYVNTLENNTANLGSLAGEKHS